MTFNRRNDRNNSENSEFEEKLINVNRTAKTYQGGRRFRFAALVILGDRNGRVGMGIGKAKEVPVAIEKAKSVARKNMITVPVENGTIPHEIVGVSTASRVLLKPASAGTGVIAGGACRAVLECAGVHDILAKSLGSDNAINVVHATVAALKMIQRPEEDAARRGLPIEDVAPPRMLKARRESEALAAAAAREGSA